MNDREKLAGILFNSPNLSTTYNSYGRPCVRALNAMCREKRITIDYEKRNYEEVWDGRG